MYEEKTVHMGWNFNVFNVVTFSGHSHELIFVLCTARMHYLMILTTSLSTYSHERNFKLNGAHLSCQTYIWDEAKMRWSHRYKPNTLSTNTIKELRDIQLENGIIPVVCRSR